MTLKALRGDRLAGLSALPALDLVCLKPNRASRAGRLVRKFAPSGFRVEDVPQYWPRLLAGSRSV